ncbi:septum formation initiator family protein [Nocardioides sp. AE5]|uniref:FtsB family cell division protein n=1 Tax=Nocardioides sp. AE5 TaxID=2962573 RepID=UPI002882B17A|nr:septum formation initiator family protein [Nocardioides sp. AE5]MDT0202291.1 septum formation initiator family protein [Nocardioides sp. AE5]
MVVVLAVSYASSMRAYLQQQDHASDLRAQIARTEVEIDALEREKKRWSDEAFIEAQARLRLGYVMPGETTYVVLDENGKALESTNELPDADTTPIDVPDAWWDTMWGSLELAGNPELAEKDAPAEMIEGDDSE